MRRMLLALGVALLMTILAALGATRADRRSPPAAPAGPGQAFGWSWFSPDDRCSFLTRSAPRHDRKDYDRGGRAISVDLYSTRSGSSSFMAAITTIPEARDPAAILANARDGSVARVRGVIVSDREIEVEGRPGRDLTCDSDEGGNPIRQKHRFVIDKDRLIALSVAGPPSEVDRPDTDIFLLSMNFRGRGASPAPASKPLATREGP